jgi:hypothetical protein
VIEGHTILEQVSRFLYLGYELSYAYDMDVENKLHRSQAVCTKGDERENTDRHTIKIQK